MRNVILAILALVCGSLFAGTVAEQLRNGYPMSAAPITPTAGGVMVSNGTAFYSSQSALFNGAIFTNVNNGTVLAKWVATAAQSADMTQFTMSDGVTVLARITKDGYVDVPSGRVQVPSDTGMYSIGAALDAGIVRTGPGIIGITGLSGGASAAQGASALYLASNGLVTGAAVANQTPSAVTTDHSSDGTTVTITTTTPHNYTVGRLVTLSGWTWAAGGGNINGTWGVTGIGSTTTFRVTPTFCPTAGSNPTVVPGAGSVVSKGELLLGYLPAYAAGTEDVIVSATSNTNDALVLQARASQAGNLMTTRTGIGSAAALVNANGYFAGPAFILPAVLTLTPSATLGAHVANGGGTAITVTTTQAPHKLVIGSRVTFAGWTWAGFTNGTYIVSSTPTSNTFVVPAAATAGSNPTGVGTLTHKPTIDIGTQATVGTGTQDVVIPASAATSVPLTIVGAGSQSANLQNWTDSTGAVKAYVGSAGASWFPTVYFGTSATDYYITTSGTAQLGTIQCRGSFLYMSSGNNNGLGSVGAGTISTTDGTNAVLQLGTNTAAFNVTNTAGPDVTIRTRDGNGASNASGNLILQTGTPGSGGARGTVQCPGADANSVAIGPSASATGDSDISIGKQSSSSNTCSMAIGVSANASLGGLALGYASNAINTLNIAIGTACYTTGVSGVTLGCGSNVTALKNDVDYGFNVHATPVLLSAVQSQAQQFGSSSEAILACDQIDVTQTTLTRGANAWTVAVSSNTVTVDTIVSHLFSINQAVYTDANWTNNTFMRSIAIQILTVPTTHTFTFALTQADQGATAETNAAANFVPGDIGLVLSTNTTFFPANLRVWVSTSTGPAVLSVQPTVRFSHGVISNAGNKRSVSTNVATMTTNIAHGFEIGDTVIVEHCTDATYNGTFTITAVPSLTTFSYALTHADEAAIADGTVNFAVYYVAPTPTSSLGGRATSNRWLTFANDEGGNTLRMGITAPGVLSSGTVCKIRFAVMGAYIRD